MAWANSGNAINTCDKATSCKRSVKVSKGSLVNVEEIWWSPTQNERREDYLCEVDEEHK